MKRIELTRAGVGMAVGEPRDPRLTEDGFSALCLLVDRCLGHIMEEAKANAKDEEVKQAFRNQIDLSDKTPYLEFFRRHYRTMENVTGTGKHMADFVWGLLNGQKMDIP